MIGTEPSRATVTIVPSDRHRTRTVREGGVGNGVGEGGWGGGGGVKRRKTELEITQFVEAILKNIK